MGVGVGAAAVGVTVGEGAGGVALGEALLALDQLRVPLTVRVPFLPLGVAAAAVPETVPEMEGWEGKPEEEGQGETVTLLQAEAEGEELGARVRLGRLDTEAQALLEGESVPLPEAVPGGRVRLPPPSTLGVSEPVPLAVLLLLLAAVALPA